MKRYIRSSSEFQSSKRTIIEEYLRKYCPEYLGNRNKDFLINQIIKEFESGKNPFRRYSSDFNDSMSQVWESYRRKYMQR